MITDHDLDRLLMLADQVKYDRAQLATARDTLAYAVTDGAAQAVETWSQVVTTWTTMVAEGEAELARVRASILDTAGTVAA